MYYVNSRFLSHPISGTERFAIEISLRLKKIDHSVKFIAPRNILHDDIADHLEVERVGHLTGHLWEQIELPIYMKAQGTPLLLNLANTAPLTYKRAVVTIHDVSFKRFPHVYSRKFRLLYGFLIPKIARKALHVFTVSNFARNEIVREFGLPESKVSVVYNAPSSKFKPTGQARLKDTILNVGSIQPNKNLKRLIEACKALKPIIPDLQLVAVGGGNSDVLDSSGIREAAQELHYVRLLDRVSDDELVKLYNEATLFVFPSLYEGFGTPIVEAMACGCPVITSNVASMPEVAGDAAIYCDPWDADDIASQDPEVAHGPPTKKWNVREGAKPRAFI